MNDGILRTHLVNMLTGPNAHATFEDVVADYPPRLYTAKLESYPHPAWAILEHMRICQWDILEFSRNPEHVSPDFPEGYWPGADDQVTEKDWQKCVERFRRDLDQMAALIEDPSNDLFEPFPHGSGQNLLREALLLAKHNSYHLGQLALIKKAL